MDKRKNIEQLDYHEPFFIAVGASRFSTSWENKTVTWKELIDRLREPVRSDHTVEEYKNLSKEAQGRDKDVGGFVGGKLSGKQRKAKNVEYRTVITLDMDNVDRPAETVFGRVQALTENSFLMYSTHSHRKGHVRLRLLIPVNRPMLPDEYQAVARKIAERIGMDLFDATTFEPSRLMYWPSCPKDGTYYFRVQDGPFLDPAEVRARYDDWTDSSEWPTHKDEKHGVRTSGIKQEDPLTKPGVIGAFCRAYPIEEAMREFLPGVYEATDSPDRYTYSGGSTAKGLIVYEDRFVYSHHSTDPASGLLCNAFDLVRIHLYGDMDEGKRTKDVTKLPSFEKMSEFASSLPKVKQAVKEEKDREVLEDFEYEGKEEVSGKNWFEQIELNPKTGEVLPTIQNIRLILQYEEDFRGKMHYDEFSKKLMAKDLPWAIDDQEKQWSDADDAGLREYMESKYKITSRAKIEDAKIRAFQLNAFHPVREYLESLTWDGEDRISTIFHDYLGAEKTEYNAEIARIHFTAAVKRIMEPGCKYDTMVALAGDQGIGKSTFIAKLAKDWFSDSLDVMGGKEGMESLQGKWHIELGEMATLRKSDRNAAKRFLSKQEDSFRVAYGRNVQSFERQCVFWGTSNDYDFLRDPTGDRRTLPVRCSMVEPTKDVFTDLDGEVDQIWAQAVQLYRDGQRIYVTGDIERESFEMQKQFKEDTPWKGLIEDYLSKEYPINWDDLSLADKRNWLDNEKMREDPVYARETAPLNKVCALQVWVEVLGNDKGNLKPQNSKEINDILRGLDGWEQLDSVKRFGKIYGPQRGFERVTE